VRGRRVNGKQINAPLKTIKVSGVIMLNGKDVPANTKHSSATRGSVRFYNSKTGAYVSADLGHSASATYSVTLYPGTYDVKLVPNSAGYQDALPPYAHLLQQGVALTASTNKTYDVKTVQIGGAVWLDGKQLPANTKHSSASRGSLRFYDVQSSAYASADLGHDGAAIYVVELYAGTYDVKLVPQSAGYQDVLPPYTHTLAESLALTASNNKQGFFPKTVQVGGTVTLNGKQVPANTKHSSASRASLRFVDRKTYGYASADLGHDGTASYAVTLFSGDYDVQLVPQSAGYQDALPAYSHVLQQKLAISASATKSYDLKTVQVSGLLTLDGKQLPDNTKHSSASRGSLRFSDSAAGSYASADLGHSGPGSYTATLYAGTYDVQLVPQSAGYQDVLPAYTHQLAEALALSATIAKDFDVKTVNVAGVVTLDGAKLPDNTKHGSASRGSVRFTDRLTGAYVSADLGHDGTASYVQQLYPGTYDVDVVPNSSGYQDVLPPYQVKVRVGCFTAGPCSLSKSDVSGAWRLITPSSWGTVYLDLKQSGQSLGGSYKYSTGSGAITAGTVKGDNVEVSFKTYSCSVAISGALQDGCTWTGTFAPTGVCSGGWGLTTSFFAQRSK